MSDPFICYSCGGKRIYNGAVCPHCGGTDTTIPADIYNDIADLRTRLQTAEQQLGQVREVNNKLHWALESQPCTCLDGDPCVRCVGLSEWKVDLTPSDGCGKGTDKGNCRCLACGHIHFWNERIIGPFGGHTYCPKVQCIHAQYEQLTEAASSSGKEGV